MERNRAQGGTKREEVRTGSATAGNEKTKKKGREKRLKQRGGRKKHESSKKQKDAPRIMGQKEVMTHGGVEGKVRKKPREETQGETGQ